MPAPVLQFKRGIVANLPGLRAGEPGFTTDSYDLYVGLTSETSTNKFFGSHRYWTKDTTSTGSGINLLSKELLMVPPILHLSHVILLLES